jgi:hypothetical protein
MLCAIALGASLRCAQAQQLEPRIYSNAPIGLNFLIAAYGYSWGDVLLDPSVPISNVDAKVNSVVIGYSRVLDFWGESGTLSMVLPYASVSANGDVEGLPASIKRSGFADLAMRLSVNLRGLRARCAVWHSGRTPLSA